MYAYTYEYAQCERFRTVYDRICSCDASIHDHVCEYKCDSICSMRCTLEPHATLNGMPQFIRYFSPCKCVQVVEGLKALSHVCTVVDGAHFGVLEQQSEVGVAAGGGGDERGGCLAAGRIRAAAAETALRRDSLTRHLRQRTRLVWQINVAVLPLITRFPASQAACRQCSHGFTCTYMHECEKWSPASSYNTSYFEIMRSWAKFAYHCGRSQLRAHKGRCGYGHVVVVANQCRKRKCACMGGSVTSFNNRAAWLTRSSAGHARSSDAQR